MKNEGLRQEELYVGEVFIKEYNKLHNSDYNLKPNSVDTEDTDADLIFHSSTGSGLFVQITIAVTSENEEKEISKNLKENRPAWVIGNGPNEEIIIHAAKSKSSRNYANPQELVLVIYRFGPITLTRNFRLEGIGIRFCEVWFVKCGQNPWARRIHP